ncbi:MAG: hypothetical protein ABIP93_19150 [Gemmatimonadaceae bacterium]
MTRSRKKTPIRGVTSAASEKADKAVAHRKERKRVRTVLHVDPEPEVLPHTRELSDPWDMAKDGKVYLGSRLTPKERRK